MHSLFPILPPIHTGNNNNIPPEPTAATTATVKLEEKSKPLKKSSSCRRLSQTDSADRPRKKQSSRKPTASSSTGSMTVSIDRAKLKSSKVGSVARQPGKKKVKKREGEEEGAMVVKVERRNLGGVLGTIPPPLHPSDSFTMMTAPPPSQPSELLSLLIEQISRLLLRIEAWFKKFDFA